MCINTVGAFLVQHFSYICVGLHTITFITDVYHVDKEDHAWVRELLLSMIPFMKLHVWSIWGRISDHDYRRICQLFAWKQTVHQFTQWMYLVAARPPPWRRWQSLISCWHVASAGSDTPGNPSQSQACPAFPHPLKESDANCPTDHNYWGEKMNLHEIRKSHYRNICNQADLEKVTIVYGS